MTRPWSFTRRSLAVTAFVVLALTALGVSPVHAQTTFSDPGFSVETVAALPAFTAVGLTFAPDGRILIWQREGIVRIYKNGALLPTPFLDIHTRVNMFMDRGLLGLALDPDFQNTGWVYVLYTVETGGNQNDSGPKFARFSRVSVDPANPDVALPASEVIIIDGIPSESQTHTIGTVRFAPDGTLFISVGDGAEFAVPEPLALRAQDLNSYSGKILRVNPDGTAPANNPFYDGTNSIRSKVWALGLRNPFRFALHPVTAEPYIGDVGWNTWEEINRATAGANFGWPCYEGNLAQPDYQSTFAQCQSVPSSSVTAPLLTYNHAQGFGPIIGNTAIGGTFYTATVYPAQYHGNLFIADYTTQWIYRMVFDPNGTLLNTLPFAASVNGPVSLEVGPDGFLYFIAFNTGQIGRIRFNGPAARASATPEAGYSPLTVSFSSSGSQSPNGTLSYSWQFGDGATSTAANPTHTYTVSGVQTFTATLTVTDPASLSSSASVAVTVGSQPPTAAISTPANGTAYAPGDTIAFQGSASDPDDGTLGPASLEWTVLLHHNGTHVHPVITTTGSGGSFLVVDHGAGTYSYEIILTATDSSGLTDTKSVTLPVTQRVPTGLTFNPNPVIGGESSTGTVSLSVAAPPGGAVVTLSSNHAAAQVPASVTVPAGSISAPFTVATSVVSSSVSVSITATLGSSLQSTLTVNSTGTTLTSANPATGIPGQALSVILTGSNFASGATCSFGAGITVSSCAFNSVTRLTATLAIASNATVGARTVTVTNPTGPPAGLANGFTVNASGPSHFDFGYTTRSALLGAGWDFIAKTASGGTRNTEQTGALAVSYDQVAHPGSLRIPLGPGEIWQSANDSENTVFRDLPANWTSIRLRIVSFSPTANYQQVGLLAYQNDDNYVNLNRGFVDSALVELFVENSGSVPGKAGVVSLSNSGNLILRLDRSVTSNAFTAFYSTNGGGSWTQLPGTVTKVLANPRLAIQVGANLATATPAADLAWVEIFQSTPAPPPTLTSLSPGSAVRSQSVSVVVTGSNFVGGATCDFGPGITVSACTYTSPTQLTASIAVASNAAVGPHNVTVSNPDGQTSNFIPFDVIGPAAPALTSATPTSGGQGQVLSIVLAGSNFLSGATCTFGAGITVTACTYNTASQLTASIAIAANAPLGPRDVIVTNPDGQASNSTSFTVTAAPAPTLTSVTPNAGGQGEILSVALAGTHFLSGATCTFGAGITVSACTYNTATQLTASITIAGGATLGARQVIVSNPDGQASNSTPFTVTSPAPPPTLSSLSPTSGSQGQSLSVVLSGSNFLSGATCSFGSSITVTTCAFVSSTQLTASLTIASGAALGARDVGVTNPGGQSATLTNAFSVTPASGGASHLDFTYADRAALLAASWDFVARTAAGGPRNTEQSGVLAVNYDQTAHPGSIRVPLGSGEMWAGLNNSQNTLFRDLPADWTSIRLKIAAFSPVANYQQVGLLAYQNDDNYVDLNRGFINTAQVELFVENSGTPTKVGALSLSNTGNLVLRLDRNSTTNVYTAFYSVNDGTSWTQLPGTVTKSLTNPRLGIQVGANEAGTTPNADIAWVEIFQPSAPPPPSLLTVNPSAGLPGQTLSVVLSGANFLTGATCAFGAGITVSSCTFNSGTQLTANVTISAGASPGSRSVTVTNPGGQSASLADAFAVNSPPPPAITSVTPVSGSQGQSLSVVVSGSNFLSGASCALGSGITVSTCAVDSATQLTASLSIATNATLGARTVVVTNPDGQASSAVDGFSVTVPPSGATANLTVAVLVNSANSTGYNPAPGSPGEFQRYAKLYFDHLQVPYEVIDTAISPPPADLGARQLIVAAHVGLGLSPAWQAAIASAVGTGTGFVNLDADPAVGRQSHMQTLFGASGSVLGSPATAITVPAAVIPGGATPHFIAALQRRFLGDPPGDLVYAFHPNAANVVQPATPTVLQGATGTVLARLGASPLLLATATGGGRAVHFSTLDYLKADRFGFVQGLDDLFWRSLVWAARKPFVLRGYPRFWAVQMDDTMPGWIGRVRDLYDPALTGPVNANGTGGPWKVTGYVFTNNLPPGGGERAGMIADITAGKLRVAPHAFGNVKYGDMYWNAATGPLSDSQWLANLAAINAWRTGNGGADTIPAFSRSLVAHYWDLSNNTGEDLWTTLGVRYITAIQKPGVRFPDQLNDLTIYTGDGSERLHAKDFWAHELPPKTRPDENFPFFFADDYTVGSRPGLPPRTFFSFASQYIDFSRYPRPDFIWPSGDHAQSVEASIDQLRRYTWRHWSGLSPAQIYTHDVVNYQLTGLTDRQVVTQESSAWLEANGVRHIFMDDLGDYLYARSKSTLLAVEKIADSLQLTFAGASTTADGAAVSTQLLVFYQDVEAVSVGLPSFTGPVTLTVALPVVPPSIASISPSSGPADGETVVTISGANFSSVTEVQFGGIPATFTVQSSTSIVATTPAGAGVVDVTVHTTGGSATLIAAYTYIGVPAGASRFEFTYPSRAALLSAGWSFVAVTPSGGTRNTEQSGSLAVNYDQTVHPGTIRIPIGSGEIWQTVNNSQNTLFRALPADWTSIRLKIASFNPIANYQQVGLLAYQDDNNYVNVNRVFVNGGQIELFVENSGAVPGKAGMVPLANAGNLVLRLDRDPSNNTYTSSYSLDDGETWFQVPGSVTKTLTNPKLAIQIGANTAGGTPVADLAWAEILQ